MAQPDIILKKDKNKINRIFHISDVHISNNNARYTEYHNVFEKLFKEFESIKANADDVIMITGDTVDQADILTPQCIELVKYFFIGLTNFCPVLVTLGNHELNFYDPKLLDSLTPIIKDNFTTKNQIHMLLENANYIYHNLYISVTVVGSPKVTKCVRKKNYVNIKTYHGIIHGSTAENSYVFRNNFALKDFGDFDWLLLGDIHLFQYLNKAKTAWYPSSLVQKSRQEDPVNHGFMLLDLNAKTTKFIKIQNDYASYNLILSKDGKLNYDINSIAKFADIKITLQTTDGNHLEKIKNDIFKKGIKITNFIETSNIMGSGVDTTIKIKNKSEILTNVNSDKQLINIIMDYIKENQKLDSIKMDDIKSKLIEILKNISTSVETLKNKNIVLDSLEFSNVLVFGLKNRVDFKNGSYYLSEPNSSGKSCLIDILSIALHSKSPRVVTRGDLIRHNQLEASTKIKLYVNNILYTISRNFKRKTTTSHPTETIVLEKNNEVIFDLEETNGKNKKQVANVNKDTDSDSNEDIDNNDVDAMSEKKEMRDRNKIKDMIDKEIISYDDLFLCSIVSQTKKINFLTSENKKDLLLRYSGLSIFSDISQYSAKKCGELTRQLGILYNDKCFDKFRSKTQKRTKSDTVSFKDTDMENIKKQIELDKKTHDKETLIKTNEFNKIEKKYNDFKEKKIRLEETLKTSKVSDLNFDKDIEDIKDEINLFENQITKISEEIKSITKNKATLELQIKKINKSLDKFPNIELEKQEFESNKKVKAKQTSTQIISLTENLLKTTIKQNSNAKKEIASLKKSIVSIEEEINLDTIKQKELQELIDICNDDDNVIQNYKLYRLLQCDIEILEYKKELYKKEKLSSESNKVTKEIEKENKKLKSLEHYKVNFEKYKSTQSIKKLNDELNIVKQSISEKQNDVIKKNDLILNLNNYLSNIETKTKITSLENELEIIESSVFENYETYKKEKNNLEIQEKELNKLSLNLEKQKNLQSGVQLKLDNMKKILKEYEENSHQINQYKKIKKEFDVFDKEYKQMLKTFENKKKDKQNQDLEDKQHFANYKIALTNYEKYIKIKEDKNSYSTINNLLMKNGLIDSILKDKVLVKLEQTTNNILKAIDHKPLSIKMIDKKGNKYKTNEVIITNLDGTIAGNCGYFERNVMELAIRMAISQINNFVKINAVFVDECFDGASKENYNKIIKLIEHFKDYYAFNLVISHDEKLVSLFDNRIKIIKPKSNDDIKKNGFVIKQ